LAAEPLALLDSPDHHHRKSETGARVVAVPGIRSPALNTGDGRCLNVAHVDTPAKQEAMALAPQPENFGAHCAISAPLQPMQ